MEHAYGCLPAKKDLRDYKICTTAKCANYPEEFKLKNLPAVKNQKSINSCCAHATSSILEYFDKNQHTLSTNFIYGIQKKLFGYSGMGMYLQQACKIVKNYGDMLEEDCKGNTEVPACWDIANKAFADKNLMDKAYNFRTINYYLCKTDNDIKHALMNYGPVLGAINWKNDYKLINNIIYFNKNSEGGGHAIMIYGWNKDGWLIQNSWGKNFGNCGRFILPFDYGFSEARALVDYEDGTDVALVKPKRGKLIDLYYKIANFILNIFR